MEIQTLNNQCSQLRELRVEITKQTELLDALKTKRDEAQAVIISELKNNQLKQWKTETERVSLASRQKLAILNPICFLQEVKEKFPNFIIEETDKKQIEKMVINGEMPILAGSEIQETEYMSFSDLTKE